MLKIQLFKLKTLEIFTETKNQKEKSNNNNNNKKKNKNGKKKTKRMMDSPIDKGGMRKM